MHGPLNVKFNEEFFRGMRRSNSSADQSRPSSNEAKNTWSSNSILIRVHVVTNLPYFVRVIPNTSGKAEFLNVKVTGKYSDRCPTEGYIEEKCQCYPQFARVISSRADSIHIPSSMAESITRW
jgi:hypothetical protein